MSEIDDRMLKYFGPQPDGLFLAIGRLSALTSLLDVWVCYLLATLVDHEPMAKYETMGFHEHAALIREKATVLPPDLQKEVKQLLGRLTGLRNDRNASVHTLWSQHGFGWRNDLSAKEDTTSRVLTFQTDQTTMETKVLKAARLVDQLVDLQERSNRLQVERYLKE